MVYLGKRYISLVSLFFAGSWVLAFLSVCTRVRQGICSFGDSKHARFVRLRRSVRNLMSVWSRLVSDLLASYNRSA